MAEREIETLLAADELAHDPAAENERLRQAMHLAAQLVAEAYSEDEDDDSPGNRAFAVLNAALAGLDHA